MSHSKRDQWRPSREEAYRSHIWWRRSRGNIVILVPEGEQAYILITRSEVGVQKEIYTYTLCLEKNSQSVSVTSRSSVETYGRTELIFDIDFLRSIPHIVIRIVRFSTKIRVGLLPSGTLSYPTARGSQKLNDHVASTHTRAGLRRRRRWPRSHRATPHASSR